MSPKYPIYIISKGRWDNPKTAKNFDKIKVSYKIVVEPQEYDNYCTTINPDKILVLPFSNLGQGGIPARNWVWEHSIKLGAKKHWIFDDNISTFYRLNNNKRLALGTGSFLRCAEDFVDRYENVPMAGLHYMAFVNPYSSRRPPFTLNTRVYSMILLSNDVKYRWRGKYNEDTDLSIRILKDGYCTILFNIFMGDKTTTMTMSGGNTEDLYEIEDGRLKMAQSLQKQHPDIVTIKRKFGRWQHDVNYNPFKNNKLILKKNLIIPDQVNNYGMRLIKLPTEMK